jgi:hypothetical protein
MTGKSLNLFAKAKSMRLFKENTSSGRPSAAQKQSREKLHLFVSNITGAIHPDSSKGTAPSPFVRFVSTPSEACQMNISKWDKFRKKLRVRKRQTKKDENRTSSSSDRGATSRTMSGWPRTKKLKGTYQPDWAQEDIHFVVRTHGDEGLPIDLTGAMLHIAVFDGKMKHESRLIGTFTLNLAHLINKARERNSKMPQTASSRNLKAESLKSSPFINPFRKRPSEIETSEHNSPFINRFRKRASEVEKLEHMKERVAAPKGVLTQGPSLTLQSAMHANRFASRARKQAQAALNVDESSDLSELNIQALSLDEPLVKNGREVGRIQCTLDSWWLKEEPFKMKSKRFSVIPK